MSETIDTSEKIREGRARRALAKLGYRLTKTPARSWLRKYYGAGYMIVGTFATIGANVVLCGSFNREYELSLEDVEAGISRLQTTGRA